MDPRLRASPEAVIDDVLRRRDEYADPAVWIHRLSREQVLGQLEAARSTARAGVAQPLLGVPFAVKDNMDVAGLPTTAGCPDFSYIATRTAAAVQRLHDAGAILVGKTNLDQFATGLVGTRSPFGACKNTFDPRYISGGSSSGSAVAVAAGLVSFSLGTDTAGSGRVPAAFNNIVGLKPTRGLVSTAGVVPACRSLDCVSIFSLTCDDAVRILRLVAGIDDADAFSRPAPPNWASLAMPRAWRFGIPRGAMQFFGYDDYARLYAAAIDRMAALGGTCVEVDYEPFAQAAQLLYGGPWVAERYAAIKPFIERSPQSLLPITRSIIEKARQLTAVEAFEATYRLAELRAQADRVWRDVDVLLLPTAGTIYTHDLVAADPLRLNTNLGHYTNFMNLLDCCGIAVPAGLTGGGLPFGVTLAAPAWRDALVGAIGQWMQEAAALPMGATGHAMPTSPPASRSSPAQPAAGHVHLAVVGAHLTGQPLNWQLTEHHAVKVRACRTAPLYRLFALADTTPPKPGLVRVNRGDAGHAIEVEVWDISQPGLGRFMTNIPPPLGIGTLTLEDGQAVRGFICEPCALEGATDISRFGGWRSYLASSAGRAGS